MGEGARRVAMVTRVVVLHADDAMREICDAILTLEGYSVTTAADGGEGLWLLQSIREPCVVLLHNVLPVMSGFEMMRIIARRPELAERCAFVLMTPRGYEILDNLEPSLLKLSASVVSMPFTIDELVEVIDGEAMALARRWRWGRHRRGYVH